MKLKIIFQISLKFFCCFEILFKNNSFINFISKLKKILNIINKSIEKENVYFIKKNLML